MLTNVGKVFCNRIASLAILYKFAIVSAELTTCEIKLLKFRKGETPLIEPARAMLSPFPEGRDLG